MTRSFSSTILALSLVLGALLAGCGDDGSPPLPDGSMDAAGDSGGDAAPGDCATAVDGTSCGGAEICLRGVCTPSRCGDGYVDTIAGETCDDGNDLPGDGCEPGSCMPSCAEDADCDDGDPCSGTEMCNLTLSRCQAGAPGDGMTCTLAAGGDGVCSSGLCAPPGCGNGVVDGMEQCDDGMNGDNDDGCRDDCQFTCEESLDCSDSNPCNGEEVCDTDANTCGPGMAPSCDDSDTCTADSCTDGVGCLNDPIDVDGDGFSPGTCTTAGLMGGDCDDTNFTIYPGAMELCDSLDNDCDGTVDNGTVDITCYRDADGDTYGDPGDTVVACTCPAGYISRGEDCDDTNMNVNPMHTTYERAFYCPGGGTCATADRSWDWNCDGVQTQEVTNVSTGCAIGPPGCRICACLGSGWTTSVPACGQPSGISALNYRTCSLSGFCASGGTLSRRTQACR